MILRRYGKELHSVDPAFDPRAMNEIGFRKNGAHSMPVEEFESDWERIGHLELSAESEGNVQDEAEAEVLDRLEGWLRQHLEKLKDDQVLVVESEPGKDYPKTRDRKENRVVDGENRLHFFWRVDPPLRVGIFRKMDR